MSNRRRWIALGLAVVLLVVAVLAIRYVRQHRGTVGPVATAPPTAPPSPLTAVPAGPTTLYVVDRQTLQNWGREDFGTFTTIQAIQGLANRNAAPTIFLFAGGTRTHDQDWLQLLQKQYGAGLVSKPDAVHQIDDLAWYLRQYRSLLQGYILFDAGSARQGGPAINLALSLAGALDAVPIDRNDQRLLQAARSEGLSELADVSGKDYGWLKSSKYWPLFNKQAIFYSQPNGVRPGGDYAVALKMAVFWDDVRSDPDMRTMAAMISDQKAGGIVFGWGYTDANHKEDIFVGQASRYSQSVMDTPPNLSVYMHYPLRQALANTALPALPTDLHKHYVSFVYSDGDNPRVVFDELTLPGNDRYASPLRGRVPVGWTLPPTIPNYAAPVVAQIFASATPADVFVAGPSGYGYAFPSLIPQRQLFGIETQDAMTRLDLHDISVLDTDGRSGFTNAALDPLTSGAGVQGIFYSSFDARHQPAQGSVLWSNGKPVLPTYTLNNTKNNRAIVNSAASYFNSRPKDATTAGGYTAVYVDFWSISMTDLVQITSQLAPDVQVVRPDVLAALAAAHVAR